MIKKLKCVVCEELIGTLDKPIITEEDTLEYSQMVVCSLEHSQTPNVLTDEATVGSADGGMDSV